MTPQQLTQYQHLLQEIDEALESGVSLTMDDLNFEAQELMRIAHPTGDYPIPDLSKENES